MQYLPALHGLYEIAVHEVREQVVQTPFAHASEPVTLIDRELFRFDEIWAAAGHPHGVFKLRPHDLERLTGGAPVADVAKDAGA